MRCRFCGKLFLFGLDLRCRIQVLHRAAAAYAEMRAARRHARRGCLVHFEQFGFVVALVKAAATEADAFARQRARDEYGLAAGLATPHHALGFVREIGDHSGLDGGLLSNEWPRAKRRSLGRTPGGEELVEVR